MVEVVYAVFMALYIGSMGALGLLVLMNGFPTALNDFYEFGKAIGFPSAPSIYYGAINVLALTFYILWSKYNEA